MSRDFVRFSLCSDKHGEFSFSLGNLRTFTVHVSYEKRRDEQQNENDKDWDAYIYTR